MNTWRDPFPDGDWFVVQRQADGSMMIAKVLVTNVVLSRDVVEDWSLGNRVTLPGATRLRLEGVLDQSRLYDPGAAVRFDQATITQAPQEIEP